MADADVDVDVGHTSNALPLAQRAIAVGFMAAITLAFAVLWYVAARRKRSPTAGYAWSTAVMALVTIFTGILAFWRPSN